MTYKIVRDAAGTVVCFGPNNGMYEPAIKAGETITIESAAPVVLPTYQELRAAAYPSIADQLDTIYHSGIDAWKLTITAVKEEFPK
tara:strand:+ start:475 stop:732 length:258 start_codon:yes stop_codon:yes gene_type:complete